MWGAITKDFGEFVSTVAADATETLESIDKNLDEPLVKGRAVDGDETNQEALIDPDTGIPLASVADDEAPQSFAETPWKSPTEASLEEMKERLIVSCEDVFLDVLEINTSNDDVADDNDDDDDNENENNPNNNANSIDEAIAAFLKDFDVATKTEEISELLKSDAALQTTFSMLSDSVTYADFWTRYFYRIDNPERLPETYSFYYQQYLLENENPEEPAPRATMGGFTSFLGGVVSKLTHESDTDGYADTSGIIDESMEQTDTEDGAVAAARSALGFLTGASGRPPFVMNTAVSDDDEDEDAAEDDDDDEDSEVELGWDDDDDEDFDGLDDDDEEEINTDEIAFEDGDDRSETVDFKDAEKEGLLEELEQAREERDALQKTVQMQAEELKKFAQNSATATATPTAAESTGDASTDALKLQLFEKDAELAALRSQLEDHHDDDEHDATSELQTQLDNLQQALKTKDHDFEELKKATQAQTKALEQKLQEQSTQQEELEELREKLSTRDRQFEELETQNESEASKLRQKLQEKQAEKEEMTLALQSQIYALKRQLEEGGKSEETLADELRTTLASTEAENSRLHRKVETAISENENLQNQLAEKTNEAEAAIAESKELQSKLVAKTTEAETATAEIQQLQNTISEVQSQLATKTQEAEKASGSASENETRFAQLQAEIADKENIQKSLEMKLQGLQNDLTNLQNDGEQKLEAAVDQHAVTTSNLETQLSSLTNDLEASKKETLLANEQAELLRNELDQLRASLLERPTSPGSSSTGVRVDVPQDAMETAAVAAPPAIPSTPNAAVSLGVEPSENDDDDDDDGWGDDW